MIERVARAMAAKDSGPEGSALFDIHWREFAHGYTTSAVAAIEAMREPTGAMTKAGLTEEADERDRYLAPFIYTAMIDAALSEAPQAGAVAP